MGLNSSISLEICKKHKVRRYKELVAVVVYPGEDILRHCSDPTASPIGMIATLLVLLVCDLHIHMRLQTERDIPNDKGRLKFKFKLATSRVSRCFMFLNLQLTFATRQNIGDEMKAAADQVERLKTVLDHLGQASKTLKVIMSTADLVSKVCHIFSSHIYFHFRQG